MMHNSMMANSTTFDPRNISDERLDPSASASSAVAHAAASQGERGVMEASPSIEVVKHATRDGVAVLVEPSFDADDSMKKDAIGHHSHRIVSTVPRSTAAGATDILRQQQQQHGEDTEEEQPQGSTGSVGSIVNTRKTAMDWQDRGPYMESTGRDEQPESRVSPLKENDSAPRRRHRRDLSEHFDDAARISDIIRTNYDHGTNHGSGEEVFVKNSTMMKSKHRRVYSGELSNPPVAHRRINSIGESAPVKRKPYGKSGRKGHHRVDSAGLDVLTAAVDASAREDIEALLGTRRTMMMSSAATAAASSAHSNGIDINPAARSKWEGLASTPSPPPHQDGGVAPPLPPPPATTDATGTEPPEGTEYYHHSHARGGGGGGTLHYDYSRPSQHGPEHSPPYAHYSVPAQHDYHPASRPGYAPRPYYGGASDAHHHYMHHPYYSHGAMSSSHQVHPLSQGGGGLQHHQHYPPAAPLPYHHRRQHRTPSYASAAAGYPAQYSRAHDYDPPRSTTKAAAADGKTTASPPPPQSDDATRTMPTATSYDTAISQQQQTPREETVMKHYSPRPSSYSQPTAAAAWKVPPSGIPTEGNSRFMRSESAPETANNTNNNNNKGNGNDTTVTYKPLSESTSSPPPTTAPGSGDGGGNHHRKLSSFSSFAGPLSSIFHAPSESGEQHPLKKGHHRATSSTVSFLKGIDIGLDEDAPFIHNLQQPISAPSMMFPPIAEVDMAEEVASPPPPAEKASSKPKPKPRAKAPATKLAQGGTSKRVRRKCTVGGCPNRVVQGGLCISHGARRKLCKHPGCQKHVKKAGLCSTHGPARKKCEAPGCSKVAVQGGRCIAHGAKKKPCSVDDCQKQAILNGMCKKHHDISQSTMVCRPVPPKPRRRGNKATTTTTAQGHKRGLSIFQEISADTVRNLLEPPSPPEQQPTQQSWM